jgi:hypothetical protein
MRIHKYSIYIDNVFGIEVQLHWSILPVMIIFGGLKFQPFFYLSFLVLILVHEIGHALAVKACSLNNHEIILHGLGGACVWYGDATQKQRSIIAWGGILAQLFVFILFLVIPKLIVLPPYDFLDQIFRAFIRVNLFLIIINLFPYDPLDGVEAWKWFNPIWKDIKSLKNKQKNQKKYKNVDDQIEKIFKENAGTPNKGSQRTRSPRR